MFDFRVGIRLLDYHDDCAATHYSVCGSNGGKITRDSQRYSLLLSGRAKERAYIFVVCRRDAKIRAREKRSAGYVTKMWRGVNGDRADSLNLGVMLAYVSGPSGHHNLFE